MGDGGGGTDTLTWHRLGGTKSLTSLAVQQRWVQNSSRLANAGLYVDGQGVSGLLDSERMHRLERAGCFGRGRPPAVASRCAGAPS